MKYCNKCKKYKSKSFFYKNKTKKDGLQNYCKKCWNEIVSNYNKTSEKRKKRLKEYDKKRNQTEKRKKNRREYFREYRKNPVNKLNHCMGRQMYKNLKENKKCKKWEHWVDYTTEDLKRHLEKLFDKNMNWDNYGSYWVIDHIKPKSLFNYSSPEDKEFKKCWSLNNLQPLERIENIIKNNNFPYNPS